MQCPNCSNLCMQSDRSCPRCGRRLAHGGLTPTKLANWTAVAFGLLMVLFVLFIAMPRTPAPASNNPQSTVASNVAVGITNVIFIGGAMFLGWIIGRVVGAVVCRNH